MRIQSPLSISPVLYVGFNTNPRQDDEAFGLSVWRFYVGRYNGQWFIGILLDQRTRKYGVIPVRLSRGDSDAN